MLISFRYFTQCFPPSPCRFQKQTGVRLQEPHTFYWVRFQQVIWILSRKTLQLKQKSIWNIENDNCLEKTYTFRKTSRHVESDPVHDDVACILSPTDCSASALLPYRQNSVHFFNIPTSSRGPRPPVFNTFYFGMCFAPQGRAFFYHPNFQKWSETVNTFDFEMCLAPQRRALFHHLSKRGPRPPVLNTFDFEMSFVPRRRALFHHLNFQKCLRPPVFQKFDFEMCFAPQGRAPFQHHNFQKWSEVGVFCTFWLGNVLHATTACTFSTSQLPKVLRTRGAFAFFTLTCASCLSDMHFFHFSTAKSGRTLGVFIMLTSKFASRRSSVQF